MRRWLLLSLICGCCVPMLRLHAEAITPAAARAQAAEAVATLVELQYFVVDHHFHHGDFDQAVANLGYIIALRPTGSDPYATAAWLLWSSKKTEEGMACIDRMIAANPADPVAYFEAGVFYVRLKDDKKAITYLEPGVKLGMTSPQRHLYGTTLMRLGRTEEALAFWRLVLAEEPANVTAKNQIEKLTAKGNTPAPKPEEKTTPAPGDKKE